MASTFTTNVNMEVPARGDYVGTWDTPLDLWATYVDAIRGSTTSLALTNANVTLTQAQQNVMRLALTGTLTGNVIITFLSGKGGRWLISNATTGAFTVTLQVGASTITATQGSTIEVYTDGTTFSTLTGSSVTTARQILTGTMLTGGGDLSADRTISMAALAAVGMLVGSPAGSTTPQGLTLGTNLSISGSTLNAAGGGSTTYATTAQYLAGTLSSIALDPATVNAGMVPVALTAGSTVTPDLQLGFNFSLTANQNFTLANPSNIGTKVGQSWVVAITQDGTGNRVITYGSFYKFPAGAIKTLSTPASSVDLLSCYVVSSTVILCTLAKAYS